MAPGARRRGPAWDEVFDGFQATVDWPGSFFYKELVEAYPDAKEFLSVRDADAWERSMRDTIWGLFYGDMLIRDSLGPRPRRLEVARIPEMMQEMWQQSGLIDAGADTTSESMRSAMERFNEGVQQNVPADRLLVWSVSDGWEPLCEFMELPVPDTAVPASQRQQGIRRAHRRRVAAPRFRSGV